MWARFFASDFLFASSSNGHFFCQLRPVGLLVKPWERENGFQNGVLARKWAPERRFGTNISSRIAFWREDGLQNGVFARNVAPELRFGTKMGLRAVFRLENGFQSSGFKEIEDVGRFFRF